MKKMFLIFTCLCFVLSLTTIGFSQAKKEVKDKKKTEAVKKDSKTVATKADKTVKDTKAVTKKDEKSISKTDDSKTVYITDSGKAYHKKNCKMVKTGKKGITLGEAKKQGYAPCKICNP